MAALAATQRSDGQRVLALWILWIVLLLLLVAAGVVVFGPDAAAPAADTGTSGRAQSQERPVGASGDFLDVADDELLAARQRVAIAAPAAAPEPEAAPAMFTVRVRGVASELLPYLRVRCITADRERREIIATRPDAEGAFTVPAQVPAMNFVVPTARGAWDLRPIGSASAKVDVNAGGEIVLEPETHLVGLRLCDRGQGLEPFALGLDQPAGWQDAAPVHIIAADHLPQTFYVATGHGPQLRVARDGLLATGELWQLDLRFASMIATLLVRALSDDKEPPKQLQVAAFREHTPRYAERDTDGWRLSLEPGDYDIRWVIDGPMLPIVDGLRLQAGEVRELVAAPPRTFLVRGWVTNCKRIEPQNRARMLRLGEARTMVDTTNGRFDLLLTSELPAEPEFELSRMTWSGQAASSISARRARVVGREDEEGVVLLEDTFAEQPKLRVQCPTRQAGVVVIQVWRRNGLFCGANAAGDEFLLPVGDVDLLVVGLEKVDGKAHVVAMQVVRCEAGEVTLRPNTREVAVQTAGGDRWLIIALAPEPFGEVPILLSADAAPGSIQVPVSASGIRAQRGSVVRDFPADATVIDLR